MPEKQEKIVKTIVVDSFANVKTEGPIVQMDFDDDIWEMSAPPHGLVNMRCFLGGTDGMVIKEEKTGDETSQYSQVAMEMVVEDGEDKGARIFYTLDSRKFRRGMSTMAAWLVKVYGKEQLQKHAGKMTHRYQGWLVEQALKKEPLVRVEVGWRGSYQMKDKQGNDIWVNCYNRYEQFPIDPEDKTKRLHIVEVTGKDGLPHEVRAMGRVERIYGRNEEIKQKTRVGGTGSSVAQPLDLIEEDATHTPAPQGPKVANAQKAQAATAVVTKEDEDSLELLEA